MELADACSLRGASHHFFAFFRFAQDAFTFFDMALRAAALHGFRFCLGLAGEPLADALSFRRFCLIFRLVLG